MNRHVRIVLALSAGILLAGPVAALAGEGRYIVAFKPGAAAAGRAAAHAQGRVVLSLDDQDAVAVMLPEQAVEALSRNPNVEYVEVDQIREPYAWGNILDAGEILPYGIQMVQADLVSAGTTSRKICIIDSGYSQQHVDLVDDSTALVTGSSDSRSGTWFNDSCGHGSHVAGTISAIAENAKGVVGAYPGVKLHIVKVFGDDKLVENGNCGWTYSSTLVNALNKCVTEGANVVSMSLGGRFSSKTEDRAFADAYKKNVLSVAAAGNDGNKATSYPAGYASVVSVAAVDANEVVASFSQKNRDVELAAPGVSVLSTVPWADVNTLAVATTPTTTFSGGRIDGAVRTTGKDGPLTDGVLCTSAGEWSGKSVLCQRGTNTFAEKVANVQAGGGVAAIIYNNVASDATCGVFTGTLNGTSTIPAISLSCSDGDTARGLAGESATVVSQFAIPGSGYEAWDGTSMATPHVSAVAALVWSSYPKCSAATIRNALNSTALDKGAAGRDTSYGYGIVQAKAALDSLQKASCP